MWVFFHFIIGNVCAIIVEALCIGDPHCDSGFKPLQVVLGLAPQTDHIFDSGNGVVVPTPTACPGYILTPPVWTSEKH